MKKTIIYLFIIAVLGLAVWYFIFKPAKAFNGEANFSVKDTNSIGKIFIARENGESITLEHRNDGWYLNKKYKAYYPAVHTLLEAIYGQNAIYPVPREQHNNVVKAMAGDGYKTEIYDRNGNRIRTFTVGGETNNGTGTYMLADGASRPYVVELPGLPLYLTPRYTTDEATWRDKSIFNFAAKDIKRATVQYFQFPINNFIINQNNGKITIDTDPQLTKNKQPNIKRASSYLTFFERVNCEGFTNGLVDIDSTLRVTEKRCIINVATLTDSQNVTIYWMPLNRRSKNLLTPRQNYPNQYDADRSYAVFNNNKDTAILQNQMLDKILRAGYEFYEDDK